MIVDITDTLVYETDIFFFDREDFDDWCDDRDLDSYDERAVIRSLEKAGHEGKVLLLDGEHYEKVIASGKYVLKLGNDRGLIYFSFSLRNSIFGFSLDNSILNSQDCKSLVPALD